MDDKRLCLALSPPVVAVLDRLAAERGVTRTAVIRQALGVLQVMHDATKAGKLVGITSDREKLETVIVAPL